MKLSKAFNPVHLEVLNESSMHNVPKDSETHFKVIIVSEKFQGQSLLQRHRSVNETLAKELESGVHALSITSKTPEQFDKNKSIKASPACLGGMKRESKQ